MRAFGVAPLGARESPAIVESGVETDINAKGGFATVRVRSSWALDSLCKAVGDCSRRAAELHAVFLHIDAEVSAEAPFNSTGDLDVLLEQLGRLPQLVIGIVERNTTCRETCLLAACDMVLAAPDLEFAVTGGLDSTGPAVPLSLLQHLGYSLAQALVALPPSVAMRLPACAAVELGLVSEVFSSSDGLRARVDELRKDFQRGPIAAVAAQRWASRRSAKGRLTSAARAVGVRGRSNAGTQPAAKRRRVDAQNGCDAVSMELLQSPDAALHDSTVDLLRNVVSGSLGAPPDQRQPFQKEVADMIAATLANMETSKQQAINVVMAMLDSADTEREVRDATLAAAESRLVEARCAIGECKARLRAETTAIREAAQALSEEEAAEAAGNNALDEAAANKAKLQAAERDIYVPLREGTLTGAKGKRESAKLVALGKQFDFDDTLLMGLPGALNQKPDRRSNCDDMFLKAFEAELHSRVAELETSIVAGEPEREARAAKVQEQREKHELARRRQQDASDDLAKAQLKLSEEEVALKNHAGAAQNFEPELRQLQAEADQAKVDLESFRKGPLAIFKTLLEKGEETVPEAELAVPEVERDPEVNPRQSKESSTDAQAHGKDTENKENDVDDFAATQVLGSPQSLDGPVEEAKAMATDEGCGILKESEDANDQEEYHTPDEDANDQEEYHTPEEEPQQKADEEAEGEKADEEVEV